MSIAYFKKALREQLKDAALMGYGRHIKELSESQLRISLNNILKLNYSYWKLAKYGSLDEYKSLFKETFKNELKIIKKQVK